MQVTDDFGNTVETLPLSDDVWRDLNVRVLRIDGELVVGAARMARTEAATEQIRTDMEQVRTDMGENTKMTKDVLDGLADVVEFFTAMKGAFKLLNWVGNVAKPVAAVVGLCTALFVAYNAWSGSK